MGLPARASSTLLPLARIYLEKPTPAAERALLQFASSRAQEEAGMLAYLALGYRAFQDRDFGAARKFLDSARARRTTVSDYADYYLALTLQNLDDHAGATRVLAEFERSHPESVLHGRANYALALSLLETGQATRSASLLSARLAPAPAQGAGRQPASASALVWSLPRPAADMLLTRAYELQGDRAAALRVYSEVYHHYPASSEAAQAARRKLGFPKPGAALRRARAEGLLAAAQRAPRQAQRGRLYLAAQQAYRELAAASSGAERESAQVGLGLVLYRQGRTRDARAALEPLKLSDTEAAAQRLYLLGECYRRMGREEDFLAQVKLLGERHPSSSWYEEALYSAANYTLLQEGASAAAHYYTTLYQRFPAGKYAAQTLWKVAWTRYREQNYEAARRLMRELVLKYPSGAQLPAALYWSGRLAEASTSAGRWPAAGQRPSAGLAGGPSPASDSEAQAYFRKAAESFPQTFYGGLARQRLRPGGPSNPNSASHAPPREIQPPPDGKVRRQKVAALKSAWLLDLAALELQLADSAAQGQTSAEALAGCSETGARAGGPARRAGLSQPAPCAGLARFWLLELARLERERGRHHIALAYAKRALPGYLSYEVPVLPRQDWELLFPILWWEEIRAQAASEGLDPYMVAGLIRQESEFHERAVSRAQARGLMQILPSTGRRLARKLRLRSYSTAALFNPQINLRLGTEYLKGLLDAFEGRLEEALAAYNAGPERVVLWREAGYQDVAEFVESIPFTETREYVQAVLRNAALYRKLYPEAGPEFSGQNQR